MGGYFSIELQEVGLKIYFTKQLIFIIFSCIISKLRGVAKFGIALGSGPRGRGFESRHSDHNHQ